MKNERNEASFGPAVNFTLPSTGVSNSISTLSGENAASSNVVVPSRPKTFFKFSFVASEPTSMSLAKAVAPPH